MNSGGLLMFLRAWPNGMRVVLVLALFGGGLALASCESSSGESAQSPSQFGTPFDGDWFKGRRE